MRVEVDDTAFATSTEGFILFADKGLNKVFTLRKRAFAPMQAYTAADGGPFVGSLDMTSGVITPVVTGLSGPGGLVFVDTSAHVADRDARGDDEHRGDRGGDEQRCQRDGDDRGNGDDR
jgi:hypothetical protein